MSGKTKIEWARNADGSAGATWNPIVGCSVVSPGCTHCYAMRTAARLAQNPATPHYAGTVQMSKAGAVWTGKVALAPERVLLEPLRRKAPTTWFVNSMGDLFHEAVPDAWIDRVFAVMALCPQHIFQVLTKRSRRMREYMTSPGVIRRIYEFACDLALELEPGVVLIAPDTDEAAAPSGPRVHLDRWPLPNVWLGVSTEDQPRANERIPDLLATPAAVRFISAEPLLGPIDLTRLDDGLRDGTRLIFDGLTGMAHDGHQPVDGIFGNPDPHLDWVIVGGESGPDARPMQPDWARALRAQCQAAGVPFFFKQWGEWHPNDHAIAGDSGHTRVGKKRAGRMLDGCLWDQMPGDAS